MKEIVLSGVKGKGLSALVDDEDYEWLNRYRWCIATGGYAVSASSGTGKKIKGVKSPRVYMHRLIMGFPEKQVDHINRVRLDNQKPNLRVATHTQNAQNSVKKPSKTGYVGVRQESENVFCARVGATVIGYYRTALEAAQARDIEALKVRGEFVVLNFSKEELPDNVIPLPLRNTGERTSNVVGVSYAKNQKRKDKWRCVFKKRHIGWFPTAEEAIIALERVKHESIVC